MIDEIFDYLSDGNWHYIYEVSRALHETERKTSLWIDFLREFGFVEISGGARLRLEKKTLAFWLKIKEIH